MIVKISGATVGVDANAYSSGDLLGTKLTLSSVLPFANNEPYLFDVVVQDLTAQKSALDVILFDADPTGTTFTNNGALDIADADLPKIIGVVSVAATDYVDFADSSVACVSKVIAVNPASGKNLYACLVARGTPTYAANELSIAFGFLAST